MRGSHRNFLPTLEHAVEIYAWRVEVWADELAGGRVIDAPRMTRDEKMAVLISIAEDFADAIRTFVGVDDVTARRCIRPTVCRSKGNGRREPRLQTSAVRSWRLLQAQT